MSEPYIILKPHGPWGYGMSECIAWMKRNRPNVREPGALCQHINQQQGGDKAAPRTEEERAIAHFFNGDRSKWDALSPDKKREYIDRLPERGSMNKAVWTTAYINDLPDSSFAYIEPGGSKDGEGKTVPRSLRHLPYKDKSGKVDPVHVRNALSRLPQTNIPASAKATAHGKLVSAAKQVGVEVSEKKKTADELEQMDNPSLISLEFALHTGEVTGDILKTALLVDSELMFRGYTPIFDDQLSNEVNFWSGASPSTFKFASLGAVWDAFPEKIDLPDDTEVYAQGPMVTRGCVGPHTPITLRINKSTRNPQIERAITMGVTCNKVRESLNFIWDSTTQPGLNLYKSDGTRNDGPQLFKPTPRAVEKEYEDSNELWFDFAVYELENGLQMQPTPGEPVQIHYTKTGATAYDGEGHRTPINHVAELNKTGLGSALVFGYYDGEAYHVSDTLYMNGEDVGKLNYIERYAKLKESFPETEHWKIIESYPVSTKAGFDSALEKLSAGKPRVVSNVTGSGRIVNITKVSLDQCPYPHNEDICAIRKGIVAKNLEYPVECSLASQYRCGYIKSMFYEEEK